MNLWFQRGAAWASSKAKRNVKALNRKDIKKVAIIRHGAIGDQVLTRVFIKKAKEFFPNATITLSLIDTYSYGAPTDMADSVHIVYKKNNGKKSSFINRYKDIKSLGEHDIIFDLANTALSKWTCLLNKASLRIGFPHRDIEKFYYDITVKRSDMVFEAENMLHLLYILGAKISLSFDYGYEDYGLETEKPYIVYFTSASNEGKTWPKENFIKLGEKMAQNFSEYRHIFLDGLHEHEKCDDIIKVLNSYDNVEKQELLEYKEAMKFLSRASMVVSNDTGVRNMAISVKTPTVGMFFATVPYRYWPREEIHQIAYHSDGEIPSPDFVHQVCSKHIKDLLQ